MFTCGACKQEIADGQAMVIVSDASVFNDGEYDVLNTEHFHSICIIIDY